MLTNLIVTGGAGFIGANFVRYALEHSEAVITVLDKLTYAGHRASLPLAEYPERLQLVEADITDRSAVDALLERSGAETIVNFAAESHVDRSIDDPGPFVTTNVVGTYVLLEAARRAWSAGPDTASGRRFLHVSTDEVYGSLGDTGYFEESTPYAPNSPYSATKAGADHLVRAYHETYGLPTITTNCSNNYGPYQFPEKLIPLMVLNALEGKPLPIYGDGGNVRDWLYVRDHCAGIWRALEAGEPGAKYNLGGDSERTNLEVVDAICRNLETIQPATENSALLNRGIARYEELKHFVTDRPGHDRRYAIDATKAKAELGWNPEYDFDAGLSATIEWFLNEREWCHAVQSETAARDRRGLTPEETNA